MSQNSSVVEKKLLHYTGKAIADFKMIPKKSRVLVCLSGGKDSFTLLTILDKLRKRSGFQFELFSLTVDQAQPGWDDALLKTWLSERHIPHEIIRRDTYSIVKEKIPEGKTYCSLCSRLRRGIIYRYAKEHQFTHIALGHHRDDLNATLLMSILYNGAICAMPPKLLTDDQKHVLIRPLCYVAERDIRTYASEQAFPIIPCNLCGSQDKLARKRVGALIETLANENPKVPSNILHAMQSVRPSQLMDQSLWSFRTLESALLTSEDMSESC